MTRYWQFEVSNLKGLEKGGEEEKSRLTDDDKKCLELENQFPLEITNQSQGERKMKYRNVSIVLVVVLLVTLLVACAPAAPEAAAPAETEATAEEPAEMRTYYMVSSHQAHPYFADSHLALRYAAEYFQVNIVAAGPEGWDTQAQADAIEVAVANKADGIITRMWDDSPAEAVKTAMAAGIPVIMTETRTAVNPGLTYIGLDNYQTGRDTAAELIARAGTTGALTSFRLIALKKLQHNKRFLSRGNADFYRVFLFPDIIRGDKQYIPALGKFNRRHRSGS